MKQDIHISTWLTDKPEEAHKEKEAEHAEEVDRAFDTLQGMTGSEANLTVNETPDEVEPTISRRAALLVMPRLSFAELIETFPKMSVLEWAKPDADRQLAVEVVFTGLKKEDFDTVQTEAMITRLTEEIKSE